MFFGYLNDETLGIQNVFKNVNINTGVAYSVAGPTFDKAY